MPVDRARRRRPQADRDRHRLVVVEQQRRHRRPRLQPVAADRPAGRVDRVAEVAQALDVVAHGPRADLEPRGELGARPVARRLEQREQAEEPRRGRHRAEIYPLIRHVSDLIAREDGRHPAERAERCSTCPAQRHRPGAARRTSRPSSSPTPSACASSARSWSRVFLAALDQTVVGTALPHDHHRPRRQRPLHVGLHRLPADGDDQRPALRQALRPVRPPAGLPVRHQRVHARLRAGRPVAGDVAAGRRARHPGPRRRRDLPARDGHRSPTSSRPPSAAGTRACSARCSGSRACSARPSAA